jgi:outer membrane protein OmpA-like peptidoglycan-associated protein
MKKLFFLGLITASSAIYAQDLPSNPEPGKCYVRCTTPDVYENEDVQVLMSPAYKKLKVIPATYKTVTEEVMVKEPSKILKIIPSVWGTKSTDYVKKEGANTLSINPAVLSPSSETIEMKPAYSQWELGAKAPDCDSADPNDCRYWCYKGYPAVYETINTKVLANDASTSSSPIAEKPGAYTTKIILEPARVEEVEVPAEYATITRTVVDTPATTTEVVVEAVYKTVSKEVLKTKGGLTEWKEVECALLEYTDLNVTWNLGSATLTQNSKAEIDAKLLPVLKNNQGSKVEIASHTDSRGSATNNQVLSEKRAQAVSTYLISKGINPSRLVSNGYGEKQLLNRCADGVSCTEREHRANRRTQFRLIDNN